jgi:hypothetical protein
MNVAKIGDFSSQNDMTQIRVRNRETSGKSNLFIIGNGLLPPACAYRSFLSTCLTYQSLFTYMLILDDN